MVGDTVDPPPSRSVKTEIVFQDSTISVQRITVRVRDQKHISYRVLAPRYLDIGIESLDGVCVQQTIDIQPGISELIRDRIRKAAPGIAKQACESVAFAKESGSKPRPTELDYLDAIVRQLNILNMLVTKIMGGNVTQADIESQRE